MNCAIRDQSTKVDSFVKKSVLHHKKEMEANRSCLGLALFIFYLALFTLELVSLSSALIPLATAH